LNITWRYEKEFKRNSIANGIRIFKSKQILKNKNLVKIQFCLELAGTIKIEILKRNSISFEVIEF
jgi:hypothetical protein